MKNINLRSLNDNDIKIIEYWLSKDYIKKWYTEPEDWLYEINNRDNEYKWINHLIVEIDGIPIGFCQYYDCRAANDLEDWYHVEESKHTFSIDYLIGDEKYLGKGYGKLIVNALTNLIFEQYQAHRIIVQPDSANTCSNYVLLANGYIFDEKNNYFVKEQ